MKQFLLIFMLIGLATMLGATRPKYSSDWNIKPLPVLKQQEKVSPQTTFTLWLVNHGDPTFDIVLTNTATNLSYGPYTVSEGSTVYVYYFEPGTYDIQVTPETMLEDYFATVLPGCSSLYVGDVGSTATIYCNDITLNSNLDCSGSIVTDIQWVGHY